MKGKKEGRKKGRKEGRRGFMEGRKKRKDWFYGRKR